MNIIQNCMQIRRAYHISRARCNIGKEHIINRMSSTEIFIGKQDPFNGIIVDSSEEPCDTETFVDKLKASLAHWTHKKRRGIWFRVSLEHANWVPELAKNEFLFHHTDKHHVMMYKWLSQDTCNIPPFAHTMLGVGAIVIDSNNKILVVQEKNSPYKFWKLPGGYVEPGEDLSEAAKREVLEETSINTEFQSLVSFRHTHGGKFNCSDIYFIVSLKATSTKIRKCEQEILACQWMEIDEFLNHKEITEMNKEVIRKYLEYQKQSAFITCKTTVHPLLKKLQNVYSIEFNPKS